MTRCFGWSLPSTSLVPLADLLNHNYEMVTHYIINKKLEIQGEKEQLNQYKLKKNYLNMKIFKEDMLINEEASIYSTKKIKYVKKYSQKELDITDQK